MGARGLQARLTLRLVVLAGVILAGVGVAAVAVTDARLDAGDADVARAKASAALEALEAELDEGDAFAMAASEVAKGTQVDGERIALRHGARVFGDEALLANAPGACATIDAGGPMKACVVTRGEEAAAVAISVAAHRAATRALARGMLVVFLVALLLSWLAIRAALRAPLAELRAVVEWTGRIVGAKEPIAPPPSATREIAQLEAAFDGVVRRLIEALARERASSAHVAHELRTPLTAIVAELASVRAADDASRAAIERVRGDVARFADVVDAILVLSADANDGRRARTVVNVADVAREVAPRGVAIDAPDEALVDADEQLVRLALRNLVDNAARHAGGARAVTVSKEGTLARVAVVDHGRGVPPADRERMFDRYWRGNADAEGRGLGLALVRAVAERHGGSARAAEGPDGAGLHISFTLGPLVGWHDAPAAEEARR